jgi:Domain of unknown function (DUF4062)
MSLRVFVSSVSSEFVQERAALEHAITRLGDLYVGMEYFGSDPRAPRQFDDDAIRCSDVYVGLFGNAFGSTEHRTGKSFTELEYDTARAASIPTLAYFRGQFVTGAEDLEQARFKARVRQNQLCTRFNHPQELATPFLIDLFALIRGPLFPKLQPQMGQIPCEVLHAVTKALVPEQIAAIGHDKYLSDLYVPRPAEAQVAEFVSFETTLVERARSIVASLETIARRWRIDTGAEGPLRTMREGLDSAHDASRLDRAIAALKRTFYFPDVDAAVSDVDRLLHTAEAGTVARLGDELVGRLGAAPYALAERLARLPEDLAEGVRRRTSGGSVDRHAQLKASIDRGASWERSGVHRLHHRSAGISGAQIDADDVVHRGYSTDIQPGGVAQRRRAARWKGPADRCRLSVGSRSISKMRLKTSRGSRTSVVLIRPSSRFCDAARSV